MIGQIQAHVGLVKKVHRLKKVGNGATGKITQGFFGVKSRTNCVHRQKMLVNKAGSLNKLLGGTTFH